MGLPREAKLHACSTVRMTSLADLEAALEWAQGNEMVAKAGAHQKEIRAKQRVGEWE